MEGYLANFRIQFIIFFLYRKERDIANNHTFFFFLLSKEDSMFFENKTKQNK